MQVSLGTRKVLLKGPGIGLFTKTLTMRRTAPPPKKKTNKQVAAVDLWLKSKLKKYISNLCPFFFFFLLLLNPLSIFLFFQGQHKWTSFLWNVGSPKKECCNPSFQDHIVGYAKLISTLDHFIIKQNQW